ncbi:amidohydrolase [Streptomyces sp. NBC_01217]|uniref:amidohydrolase n=1 Tax=Streptomyces sp. NBC_01217 TaxID=2903779 RepID=UPI002E1417C4|nr:amidohydrolase [Streptomyces sp. NBC_01217]
MLSTRITNARIITMDPARPVARELGIWRGRIVGLDEEVAGLPARRTRDLDGAVVLPGFIDSHVHLTWAGLKASAPSVAPSTRADDVLRVVGDAVARVPADAWVDFGGYDQRTLDRPLTARDLDAVSLGRKVYLGHISGHACLVNTAVLERLPADTPHVDGFLVEGAMGAALEVRPPHSLAELAAAIEHAARVCRSEGVTACVEAGVGGRLFGRTPIEAAAYQLAHETGRLPIRVQLMAAADALGPVSTAPEDTTNRALSLGLRTGFGGGALSLGALKVFTDGGMMARTAALTGPYDGTDTCGQLQDERQVLEDTIVEGHIAGWQLAIHAIGDRAVDVALDALEKAQKLSPRPEARHRVEHAGLVRPDQLPRLAALGVTVVVQPNFLRYYGDDYATVMGQDRADWLYRGRGFLDHGVRLVASSDRPVADGAPLRAVQFMVERLSQSGRTIGGAEAIGVEEALRAYTTEAARACHWESDAGSLTAGKRADLVMLGDDPRRVDVSRIGDIEVVGTWLEGDDEW